MIFKRLNRTDPEQVFIVVLANEGSALVQNQTVQWEVASASVDGVRVRQMDTGNLHVFAGIVDAAIADTNYGLIQVYGYRSGSILLQSNTTIVTGGLLVPVAGQNYMQQVVSSTTSSADVTLQPVFAYALESLDTAGASATASKKIFIRAM